MARNKTTFDECQQRYGNFTQFGPETYCNWTYDGYLCWPPTPTGHTSVQICPPVYRNDGNLSAFRRCGLDGKWTGRYDTDMKPNGWTNYTPCFPPVVQTLLKKVYKGDAQHKFLVADVTRHIEIVGFATSFISLTVSLIILMKFTSLHNQRTRIHANLFSAMNIQVLLRLILYFDQAFMRRPSDSTDELGSSLIERLPSLCVTMYVMLEYFVTAMFNWMLNEGILLNIIVTNRVLRANYMDRYYYLIGWFVPLLITAGWTTIAGPHYANDTTGLRCWYGYNFHGSYWVMQAPRLGVIVVNMGFLLNIMRVLLSKLKQDRRSHIMKARKASRAALVLLPLLGITNVLGMFEGPVAGPAWHFATWSYCTHFLRSFQGALLAWLYCLGTAEVCKVLSIATHNRVAIFRHRHPTLAWLLCLMGRRPVIRRYPRLHPNNTRGRSCSDEMPMRAINLLRSEPPPVLNVPQQMETNMDMNFETDGAQWNPICGSRSQSPDEVAVFKPEFLNISADGRLISSSEPFEPKSETKLTIAEFGQDNRPRRAKERKVPSDEPSTSSVVHTVTVVEINHPRGVRFNENVTVHSIPPNESPPSPTPPQQYSP